MWLSSYDMISKRQHIFYPFSVTDSGKGKAGGLSPAAGNKKHKN